MPEESDIAPVALPFIGCAALLFVVAVPAESTQIALVAAAIAGFGLPHGALDIVVGRRLLERSGHPISMTLFIVGYLALAALVLAGWVCAPDVTLVLFLALSVLHFGSGDLPPDAGAAGLEILVRGAAPIVLPSVLKSAETGAIFDALTGTGGWERVLSALWWTGPTWVAALGALLLWKMGGVRRRWAGTSLLAAEEAILAACFALLPVLPAFALYFCGLHSTRHLAHLQRGDSAPLVRAAMPATAVTVLVAGAAFLVWRTPLGADVAGLRVVFWGLSALTLPHMILTAIDSRAARSIEPPVWKRSSQPLYDDASARPT